MKRYFLLFMLYIIPLYSNEGTFINPITDICWECLFPITVSGVNVTPGINDLSNHNKRICTCPGTPPTVGIPVTFWEPVRLIDVTRHPYKMLGLGGISLGQETVRNRGAVSNCDSRSSKVSFYHVHYYQYPVLALLEILTDFSCMEKGELDVAYLSELDPTWNDDRLNAITNPEAALFSNPAAHLACVTDCTLSSFDKPNDALFWCAGCEGSLYPFTGTVFHHIGPIQASSLLVQRILAKLHRSSVILGYEKNDWCVPRKLPLLKKSIYKTQLVYPIAQTSGPCHALGKSDVLWGSGKSYPQGGEDFVYLIWMKKQCCLDVSKPALTGAGL